MDFVKTQDILDDITLDECIFSNEKFGTTFVISDGHITNIIIGDNKKC